MYLIWTSHIKFLVSEQKKCTHAAEISHVLLCMNTCRQPQSPVGEPSFSGYLIKGRCGIVQASNTGYKQAAITPEVLNILSETVLGLAVMCISPGKLEQ